MIQVIWKSEINNITVFICVDEWTPNLSAMCYAKYILYVAHYIDEDWRFHSALLDFDTLESSSAQCIAEKTRSIIKEYNASISLLSSDNASNMRAAFENDFIQQDMSQHRQEVTNKENEEGEEGTDEEFEQDEEEKGNNGENIEANEQFEPIHRLHCFSHVLNSALGFAKKQSKTLDSILIKYQKL